MYCRIIRRCSSVWTAVYECDWVLFVLSLVHEWNDKCDFFKYVCLIPVVPLCLCLADVSRAGAISTDGAQATLGALRWGAGLPPNTCVHAGWRQRRGPDGPSSSQPAGPTQPTTATRHSTQGPGQDPPGAQPQQDPSGSRDRDPHDQGARSPRRS